MQNHGVRDKTYPLERSVTRLGELRDENKQIKILNNKIFFTVFARTVHQFCPNNTIFFRQGGLQRPQAPPPRTPMNFTLQVVSLDKFLFTSDIAGVIVLYKSHRWINLL